MTAGGGTSSTEKSSAGKSGRTGTGDDALDGKVSGQRKAAWHSGPEHCPPAAGISATAGPARHMIPSTTILMIVLHLLMTRVMPSSRLRGFARDRKAGRGGEKAAFGPATGRQLFTVHKTRPKGGQAHARSADRPAGAAPLPRDITVTPRAASSRDATLSRTSQLGPRSASRTKPPRARPPRRRTRSPLSRCRRCSRAP